MSRPTVAARAENDAMIGPVPRARLAVLAIGTFAIGTDGFVIAGVMPAIARDTHVTLGAAGLLVTVFAVTYAVAAPLLTAAVARVDRRRVLVAAMVVLALSNTLGALATGYGQLVAARVGAGVGGALFSPIALATAVQLSPPAQRGRAVSRVLAGMTMSLVLGVPLGALLGSLGSWRLTFGFVAAVASVAALTIAAVLPRVRPIPAAALWARLALLGRVAVVANLGATFLWMTGAFTVYTFVVPVLDRATGWHGSGISPLLLAYGLAAYAGNAAGGRAADRWGARRSVLVALSSLVASLSVLASAIYLGPPVGRLIAIAALVAWAAAGWSLIPAQSHRLIETAPGAGAEVLSLNTSAVYLGIAAGAAVGGQVIAHAGLGALGVAAAGLQLLAMAVVVSVRTSPNVTTVVAPAPSLP
jgi:DHA1 family inner membrane transport protein